MESFSSIVKDIESVLKTHQIIEISFDHPDFLEEYESRLEKVRQKIINISIPVTEEVPLETHCWVYYSYKQQRYGFESRVKGYDRDNLTRMALLRPSEILRLQRREYFRVPVSLPVTCRSAEEDGKETDPTFSGTIQNISSGGLLIFTDAEVPLGSEMLLFFKLSDDAQLEELPAKIVRGGTVRKRRKRPTYEYGVEFDRIRSNLRDAIMRFVFNHQIELNRQKRM